MSAVVIHGEGLGKSYHRGALQQSTLLRDHLSRMLKSPLSVFRRPKDETFWALKDVSLEVREGEVLGLIGRNGAGKTTLLKILSRITKPTTWMGRDSWTRWQLARSRHRLPPGTHGPRKCFSFSGAILGMSKREIALQIRRNCRVRRTRKVHRYTREALFQLVCTSASPLPSLPISSRRFFW